MVTVENGIPACSIPASDAPRRLPVAELGLEEADDVHTGGA